LNEKIILFSDCILTKGVNRSIICDTKREKYYIIPNGLYNILSLYNGLSIKEIKENFDSKYNAVIDEYFEFLIDKKLVFFNSFPENFPKIELKWDSPSLITNAILDIKDNEYDIENVLTQLDFYKCSNIQFRIFSKFNFSDIINILNFIEFKKYRFSSIDFIFPYNSLIDKNNLVNLLDIYSRINSIIVYNSEFVENLKPFENRNGMILFTNEDVFDERYCGLIKSSYFMTNLKSFSESTNFNSCLNRKLSIDKNGNIKNCPSMSQSFGNVKETTLEEALNHPDFKKYWNVTKDKIDVCNDCEFRHICTDCRAYTERSHFENDLDLSKPLKCGYSPYTNEWAEWSSNPLKQKLIEYYGMQELVKKDA
jgi:SPASM domain peptide maturase of grasp-with-spasm system